MVALAVLTYALFPVSQGFDVSLPGVGRVAPVDVLAPFDFDVPKTELELARETETLDATITPYYNLSSVVVDSILLETQTFFSMLDILAGQDAPGSGSFVGLRISEAHALYLIEADLVGAYESALRRLIGERLRPGVMSSGVLEAETRSEIVVRTADGDRIVQRSDQMSWPAYLASRVEYYPEPDSPQGQNIFTRLLTSFFAPTLIPNVEETERARAELRATINPVKFTVQTDERIVAAHELVTQSVLDKLVALRMEMLERGGVTGGNFLSVVGQMSTNALVISIFWLLLTFYRHESYDELRQVMVLSTIFAVVIVAAAGTVKFIGVGPELIPIPFAAMLITVLFSGRASLVAVTALSILLGSQAVYGGLDAVYLALVGGIAGAFSVRSIQRRSQLLIAITVIAGGFLLASATVALRVEWSLAEFGSSLGRGAFNALLSAALVTIALPLFEAAASVTTDLTLNELSDPNRPLLRRLATEAPGTYAHSIAMANLTESACNAIGANGLLARVGCYYHDIGKMSRPRFFVENQVGGHNPHDSLSPAASAALIRNHVLEGCELAAEHNLPPSIVAFIPEHHGTMEISYFLDRARKANPGAEIDIEGFQYPGPRPSSAETAVTMLADSVEAALRVIEDPTEEKMADAISHIVSQRIESGQLNEAPLTLAQLDRVKREFLRVVAGMYHSRIEYPEEAGGITADWDAAKDA